MVYLTNLWWRSSPQRFLLSAWLLTFHCCIEPKEKETALPQSKDPGRTYKLDAAQVQMSGQAPQEETVA